MRLRLGSRGSRLALWQAEHVAARLAAHVPGLRVEIETLRTTGDRIADVPLARIGETGLFTKDIDRAVLSGHLDAAVHSLKDVPTRLPDGLVLGAILERDDPRDVFLPGPGRPPALDRLPAGARVGTSSLRRRAQLLNRRPDLAVEDLRGNLDTRIERLRAGRYDGILLARAGLRRLGLDTGAGQVLDAPAWLPAVGQGALAIVVREDATEIRERLAPLDHPATAAAVTAERAFLRLLEGGCQIPVGALGTVRDGTLRLYGLVASLDGARIVRGEMTGSAGDPAALGTALGHELRAQGADDVLDAVRAAAAASPPEPGRP